MNYLVRELVGSSVLFYVLSYIIFCCYNSCKKADPTLIRFKWENVNITYLKLKSFFFYFFRYRSLGHSASQESSASFYLMLDLMTFFDLFHAKKFDDAIETIDKINVTAFQRRKIYTTKQILEKKNPRHFFFSLFADRSPVPIGNRFSGLELPDPARRGPAKHSRHPPGHHEHPVHPVQADEGSHARKGLRPDWRARATAGGN